MNSVKKLWNMQQLEVQQLEKHNELKQNTLRKELTLLKNEVTSGVEEFKKGKEGYKQLKLEIIGLEERVIELKKQIETLNTKLSDGTLQNHKEMALIYDEVQLLQQKISDIETDELILIEKQEQSKAELETKSEYLKARKALYDTLKEDYQNFNQKLKQQIEDIMSNKQSLVATIDAEPMLIYRELLKRYLNPVAIVKDGVCSGCHLALNVNQKKQLKAKEDIIKCDNCGRLIFINNEE